MMLNKIITLFCCTLTFFVAADQTCIGIDYNGKLNREQGPVGYQNCSCTCGQYRWFKDGTCPTCTHKHADGKTIGNRIEIKEWLSGLTAYLEKESVQKHVAIVEKTLEAQ